MADEGDMSCEEGCLMRVVCLVIRVSYQGGMSDTGGVFCEHCIIKRRVSIKALCVLCMDCTSSYLHHN